jgi:hypothetical protein
VSKRQLFIDPGLGGTGWAFFTDGAFTNSGVLKPPSRESWQHQCHSLAGMLRGVIVACKAERVILEMPALWGGSATSYASATHHAKPGEPADLFKLTYLVGVLGDVAWQATSALPKLVHPEEWKGQLPKDAVKARIAKRLPDYDFGDHEADAVGMGLAERGLL